MNLQEAETYAKKYFQQNGYNGNIQMEKLCLLPLTEAKLNERIRQSRINS